jgi:hypothetical protein
MKGNGIRHLNLHFASRHRKLIKIHSVMDHKFLTNSRKLHDQLSLFFSWGPTVFIGNPFVKVLNVDHSYSLLLNFF